ncbi:hypothetical protein ASG29_05080 [Sphingomonas sp. Leaf412]|nr:hypothetical protein ASG29_05080 [Sphingomonas sp. Leaf412]
MKFLPILAAVAASAATAPAAAQISVEGAGARADGRWGGEIGVGYGIGAAGFRLTPVVGAFVADGDTRVVGKVEATYAVPLLATIGGGVRVGEGDATPYATVALPLLPLVSVKGNVGDGYYTLGLKLSL